MVHARSPGTAPIEAHGEERPMTEPRRTRRDPDGTRHSAPGRVDAGPGLLEPVDPSVFPDRAARRAIDGGARSARWTALLDQAGPILADGAMGTMLFLNGLQFGDPPEVWNLTQPEVIRRIHRGYLEAGSQILLTNTFGGNRLRLGLHRLESRVAELNQTAAILLRSEVETAGNQALVAGDIGPSGAIMAPVGTLDYEEAVDVFAEQAGALVDGGVDLIWIETMSDLTEIKAAIEGVRRVAPGIPLITTMTFDTRGRTMMGVTPEQAVEALAAWGSDAIGGNCGNGPDELLPVLSKMRAVAPDVLLVSKSNAGMPELVDMRAVYRASPETMALAAVEMQVAGARIVGGCCGSTPDHLRAMRAALVAGASVGA
jgi:5-methyltetrahydrofolate--homocysteine methyltransferase